MDTLDFESAKAIEPLRIEPDLGASSGIVEDRDTSAKHSSEEDTKKRRARPCMMPGDFLLTRTNASPELEDSCSSTGGAVDVRATQDLTPTQEDPQLSAESSRTNEQPSCFSSHSRSRTRSTSLNARELFLDRLDRMATRAPVSVYIIPAEHAEQLQLLAKQIGFYAAVVASAKGASNAEVTLVIGTDDAAVGHVQARIEKDGTPGQAQRQDNKLAEVVGGAMVGAGLVFAGLMM